MNNINIAEEKIKVIVLAGGKGTRIKHINLPKALISFKGKPIVNHLLTEINKTKLFKQPIVVIGKQGNLVKTALKNGYYYVIQRKRLGTGHAVKICREAIGNCPNFMVLYGDHPLLKADTIKNIAEKHLNLKNVLTMAVVKVPDFGSWRKSFIAWGRIIKNDNGEIISDIEYKDATPEQRKILEVNPSFFCFNTKWFFENICKINNKNYAKEYYLTDMVHIAFKQGKKITTVDVAPEESVGINTVEELKLAEQV